MKRLRIDHLPRAPMLRLLVLFTSMICFACRDAQEDSAPLHERAGTGTLERAVIQSKNIPIAGSLVHYLQAGPSAGPVLLLLHGGRYSSETWRDLGTLEACERKGVSVIALDLPRFGKSPTNSLPDEEFLVAFLDALGIDTVALVSPSMSGRFSLPLVARHPERVRAFLPVAPAEVPRYRQELKHNPVPTWVLWGSEDQVFDVSGAADLASLFRQADIRLLEGASHACYLDRPGEFHSILFGILASVSDDSESR